MKRAMKKTVSVPVVAVDADATASLKARETGSALVWLCQNSREEDVTELAMDARNALAERVDEALGRPAGEAASVLTDIAVRHVVSGLTAEAVLALVQSCPELVLEARRDVEAMLKAREVRVTVGPGDVYSAHVGGSGDAGTVTATIAVHRPTGRSVEAWTAEDEVLLGESVAALEARGYTVTPWASEAGR